MGKRLIIAAHHTIYLKYVKSFQEPERGLVTTINYFQADKNLKHYVLRVRTGDVLTNRKMFLLIGRVGVYNSNFIVSLCSNLIPMEGAMKHHRTGIKSGHIVRRAGWVFLLMVWALLLIPPETQA